MSRFFSKRLDNLKSNSGSFWKIHLEECNFALQKFKVWINLPSNSMNIYLQKSKEITKQSPFTSWLVVGADEKREKNSFWSLLQINVNLQHTHTRALTRTQKTSQTSIEYRWVPLYPNILKSKMAFIRSIIKSTSQSLLCCCAQLIQKKFT